MSLIRPLPRQVTRPASLVVLCAWLVTMAVVVQRSYVQASSANLATDLARYGPTAVWRGVYYRGEKIGFTVSQTTRTAAGFKLEEDGRLQMTLFGAASAATVHTHAEVDTNFVLRGFEFSLDPGTGAIRVGGHVEQPRPGKYRLVLAITSAGATRSETRELSEAPVITLNLSRLLASGKLVPGTRHHFMVLDPATLANAPVTVDVGSRSIVRAGDTSVPAFRVEVTYQGLETTSWVTDTGEVVREESPLGMMTVRETPERAQGLAVSSRVQADLLKAAAVVPVMRQRIDEGRDVRRLRVRLDGVDLGGFDLDGVGQRADGNIVELRDVRDDVAPGVSDARRFGAGKAVRQMGIEEPSTRFLAPEPLIESDAPEIQAEVTKALGGVKGAGAKAERLTRYVNALLDKKPTVSIPSAREVLRTKVGDCNEHTALYVAMARAAGLPARTVVGLVYVHGAFYYHAWPEVFIEERAAGRRPEDGWLPVDPTLNQFPADATHLRLLRGGLDKQAAILPLIGNLKMTVLDLELAPEAERILVGGPAPAPRQDLDLTALVPAAGATRQRDCWCLGFGGAK